MMLAGPVLAVGLVAWARRRGLGTTGERAAVAVVSLVVPFFTSMVAGKLMEAIRSSAAPALFMAVFLVVVAAYVALATRWLRATTAR